MSLPGAHVLLAGAVRHPHAGVGLTLLALAVVTAGFAVLLLRLKRTSSLLGELAALTAVLLVAGLVLVTRTQTCPALGCGAPAALPVVASLPTADPATTAPAAPETDPSPVRLATAAPSRRAATRPAAPVTAATVVPRATSTSPAPRPTAAPVTFTATVVRPATCSSSGGGTVDREAVLLLRNTARTPVTWHGTGRETLTGRSTPWAVLDPTTTTVAPGGTVNVGVRPDASLCRNGGPQTVRHVDLAYGRATLTVELTVYPQP